MRIKEYLSKRKVICDGAFGTYFSDLHGESMLPEAYNVSQPQWIKEIHKEYLKAGAVLLRTNTFCANTKALGCDEAALRENICAAWSNAVEAAYECGKVEGEDCFIAGDIGPIPNSIETSMEEKYEEYMHICRALTEAGADILVFETFTDMDDILPVIKDIKKKKELFVIVQFCVNQHGYSNAGISARRLMQEAAKTAEIDAVGLNCGVGPGHLYHILEKIELPDNKYITALPNAGYPRYIETRKVFSNSEEYFAGKMADIGRMGIDFLGGCCGTTPGYIAKLQEKISVAAHPHKRKQAMNAVRGRERKSDSSFWFGKKPGDRIIAVELSPQPGANDEKVMEAAFKLKNLPVDVVTFPDSPSGRTRADSIMMSMKVQHETKLCVMPHVCCRDKNAIAMRSQMLGAYVNGIRNMLIITGDPVPTLMRQDIKSVFNFDSVGLMKIIKELNQEEFAEDPLVFCGALNPNRPNLEVEIRRTLKKMEQGAGFFLTQPVFTREDAERLREIKRRTDARILCGVMPLVSYRNALFIKNEMVGINVDDEIVNCFSQEMSREEGEQAGVAIAKRVMEYTEDFADGYYFSIPFNRVYLLDKIL